MRVENWECKLESVIQKTINKDKWVLGKNDCVTFPVQCIEAITNIKVFNTKYKSLREAKKILKSMRSKDILGLALKSAKENNFKQIDINKAQRGDVLYYKSDTAHFNGTLGVCIGEKVMFNWSESINLKNKEDCLIAWKVE